MRLGATTDGGLDFLPMLENLNGSGSNRSQAINFSEASEQTFKAHRLGLQDRAEEVSL